MMTRLILLAVFAVSQTQAETLAVSPVQKVIELLGNLKGKVETDLAAEEKAMAEYLDYCDFEAKDTVFAIQTGERGIEDQEAVITDCTAKISGHESGVKSLSSEIAGKESEVVETDQVRAAEHKDFVASERELLGTVDELSRGVMTVKKGGAFLQSGAGGNMKMASMVLGKIVDAAWLDYGSKKRLTKFLETTAKEGEDSEQDASLSLKAQETSMRQSQPQASEANYESHSGGILDTLVDMQAKAEASLSEARKKEMKSAHAHKMTSMGLADLISLLKQKLADATARKAGNAEAKGKAEGEVAGMKKSLSADKAYLTSLETECKAKSAEWDGRKASAQGELEAIAKATEILSTGVTAALVQKATASHPFGESRRKAQKRDQVGKVLRDLAKKFHSYALMEMASRSQLDPFAKVKGLIEDMVTKLMNEANEEATHKSFCDEEIGKSTKSRELKMFKLDEFQSRMDKAQSSIRTLTDDVKTMQAEIADIDAAQRESAKVRKEEKENYLKTSADCSQSAEAVAQAVEVLKNYYEGASLVQVRTTETKKMVTTAKQPSFGSANSDSGGSIVSVLEVAEADFTKMLAEAEAQEKQAVDAFRKLAEEDELAKVAKLSAVKGRQSEVKSLEVSLTHYKDDHSSVGKELDAVMTYLDKLKPECETKVMSYEERKARREAEIDGLKEALAVLEGESIALIQIHRA